MMHMTAHCAHPGPGAMPLHMHIPPIGDVQYVQHPEQTRGCESGSALSVYNPEHVGTPPFRVGESP